MADFTLHIGGMATGKSEALVCAVGDARRRGRGVVVATGGSDGELRSRSYPDPIPAARVRTWEEAVDMLADLFLTRQQPCLLVLDELQLLREGSALPALLKAHELIRGGCDIVAAGLATSTEFEPFIQVTEALGFATQIRHHTGGLCSVCGEPATHAVCKVRKDGPVLEGRDLYEPRCIRCLRDNPNIPEELRKAAEI